MALTDDTIMPAAAAAGGAAGALVNRSADSRWRKSGEGLVGALVGIFCGPAIAHAAGATEARDTIAIGFIVGAAGYGLLTGVLDWLKGASVKDWLARFLGPKVPPP